MKNGIAEVNGTKLYYEITGSGHPLVLVNGSSLDLRMNFPRRSCRLHR